MSECPTKMSYKLRRTSASARRSRYQFWSIIEENQDTYSKREQVSTPSEWREHRHGTSSSRVPGSWKAQSLLEDWLARGHRRLTGARSNSCHSSKQHSGSVCWLRYQSASFSIHHSLWKSTYCPWDRHAIGDRNRFRSLSWSPLQDPEDNSHFDPVD